ncbi:MAG: hypothetical protein ACKVU2_08760 [Saprospiraceae bacterium]
MAAKTTYLLLSTAGFALALQVFQLDKTLPVSNPKEEFHAVVNTPDSVMNLLKHPKDTCDDPDANPRCCFDGMPQNLTSSLKIAPPDEPGQRMVIKGYVFKKDGKTPCQNVLIYAYHTDAQGEYSRKGDETGIRRRHGRLHAWARTDEHGRYAIESIRPASYPKSKISAHIHAVVWEPGREPYFIPEFEFADDPFLPPAALEKARKNPGSSGVLTLKMDKPTGILTGRRDLVLK